LGTMLINLEVFFKYKCFLFQLDLNMTDPMELLSYLGPSDNNNSGSNTVGNTGSNQNSSNSTSNNNDDLLALFE